MTKKNCKCGREYTLGIDGTVDGCDECEGITRNANGTIIAATGPELELDELTDMEKA